MLFRRASLDRDDSKRSLPEQSVPSGGIFFSLVLERPNAGKSNFLGLMLESRIPSSSGVLGPVLEHSNPDRNKLLPLDFSLGLDDPVRESTASFHGEESIPCSYLRSLE